MPRPITSLQVLCDHSHDWIKDVGGLAGAATWPGEPMIAAHPALWSIVRQLCELIGYSSTDLNVAPVAPGVLTLPDDVELPRDFETALEAAVAGIASPATRRVCGSKIFWARRVVQVAIAVTRNFNAVAAAAGVTRQRGRGRQDVPPHADPPHEAPTATTVPHRSDEADRLEGRAIPINMPVHTGERARSASGHVVLDEVSEQRKVAVPATLETGFANEHGDPPLAGRPDGSLGETGLATATGSATVASKRLGPAQHDGRPSVQTADVAADAPASPGTAVDKMPAAERALNDFGTAMPIGLLPGAEETPAECNRQLAATPTKLLEPSVAKSIVAPVKEAAFFGHFGRLAAPEAAYGKVSSEGSQQSVGSDSFAADLIRRLSQDPQERDLRPVLTLSVEERGYASPLLTLQQLRSLTHETIGPIASEQNSENSFDLKQTTIIADKIDAKTLFEKLFPDLEDESFERLYMDGSDRLGGDTSIEALISLATYPNSTIGLLRHSDESAFEASRLEALIGPNAGGRAKLDKSARRAAALLGVKSKQLKNVTSHVESEFNFDISAPVLGVMGPAGAGKTFLIKRIINYIHKDGPFVKIPEVIYLDCSSPDFEISLSNIVASSRTITRATYMTRTTIVLDECTFMKVCSAKLLDFFDQVIFLGDPRQLGSSNAAQWIRDFIDTAGGSHVFLDKIYRKIHPLFFESLNFVGYDGKFCLEDSADPGSTVVKISVCHNYPFCVAATMLLLAVYSAAEGDLTYIATQDKIVVEYIRGLVRLNISTYRSTKDNIKIVPISGLQGLELDTLIINPREIDRHAVDIGSTMKLVFVTLGRVRKSLALVQPIDPQPTEAPLFSFLLHSMIEGRSSEP